MFSPTATDVGYRAALAMLVGVLAAYALAAAGMPGLPAQIAFVAFLGGAVWGLAALRDPRTAWFVVIVIALLLVALGSPSDEWDPRSIWLFHAKRIYLDGSLYAQLDGYAPFSHNDYPSLVPLLMAVSAKLVGVWNEVFPKAAATLLFLPALLLIARSFTQWWGAGLFAVVVLHIGGTYLVDGYMDALLAVYAVASLAAAMGCVSPASASAWSKLVPYVLTTAVLALIKNEGIVLAGVLMVTSVVTMLLRDRRMPWLLLGAFVVALLPLLAWKLAVTSAHLVNDLAASDLKGQLLARLPDVSNSTLVLKKLLRSWALIPLLVLAVLWRRTWATPVVLAGAVAALVYTGVLYAVYLGTPHDLEWHLATSAKRTVLPVFLLLAYALLVTVDRWKQTQDTSP